MREYYRTYLANVCDRIKLKPFCVELGIANSHVSAFIRYGATTISEEKLSQLVNAIKNYCSKIA